MIPKGALAVLSLVVTAAQAQLPPGPPVQRGYLKASHPDVADRFGQATAGSGDTLVVGAPGEDSASPGDPTDNSLDFAGAAYVFVRGPGGWAYQAYLKASSPAEVAEFGRSVAISGDTIVVGARGTLVDGVACGAAHVFVRNGTTWSEEAVLTASNPGHSDHFGASVAVSGDTLVVGAPGEDSSATGINGDQSNSLGNGSGAAYVFVRSAGVWTQEAYVKASNTGLGDEFGTSVALSGETLLVGAPGERSIATGVDGDQSSNAAPHAGAAYVFVRAGRAWSQQAYLKASNTGELDQFGQVVALSDDTLVVGAYGEDSAASGVDGDGSDDSLSMSGAAYVFARTGTTWSQQAYLKASTPGSTDRFSWSVAVAGDLLLIGAPAEDSQACGVDGSQAGGGATDSGAAYLFGREAGTWSQLAYLKPSFTTAQQSFGDAVAFGDGWCAVGSSTEFGASSGVNGDQIAYSPAPGAAYAFDLDPEPWTDLTFGLAGAAGVPVLTASGPLTSGSANGLDLAGAAPSSLAVLAVGLQNLSVFFKQGAMVPLPLSFMTFATDAAGSWSLGFTWPSGIPAGLPFYLQFWIDDPGAPVGWAASNALEGVAH